MLNLTVPSVLAVTARLSSIVRLLLVIGAVLQATACGSGGNGLDISIPDSGTPNPSIEGPIDGAPTLLGTTTFDLADVGYQQSEYFISGKARSYTSTQPMHSDGKWSVRVADEAEYTTRILVYRPIDAAAFNGTVVFEWLNVSSGTEAAADWMMAHTELIRKGYGWVGVSAQKAGIDGGGANFLGLPLYLKVANPSRYGALLHPGDQYAFDMFSQAAQAVLHPGTVDPLGGLQVERALAAGESQSADFMVTYVNAIAPIANLFDGYFIHSRVHGTVGLAPVPLVGIPDVDFGSRATAHVRDDLDVPIMMVQTETDFFVLGAYPDRQDDSANFRLWEIAGAAHADLYFSRNADSDTGNDPHVAAVVEVTSANPFTTCNKPINSGPQHFIVNAAIAALDDWVRNGIVPAHADRLEIAGNPAAFVKDSVGNVLGGIRTPYVDAPTAVLSGEGQTGSVLCSLYGTTKLFDSAQLAGLYPDQATFISGVNTSVDSAVASGFLLPPDGDLIKSWAQAAGIGTP
jgi:hypothetical protein